MPSAADAPVYVLRNATAGPANPDSDPRGQLERMFGERLVFVETHNSAEGERAVREACEKASMVVAAGGDGTINAVINTMMQQPSRPPLGLIPLGTANNLCRALGVPLTPREAYAALGSGRRANIDLAKATCDGQQQYFTCVASGGNSDRVIECLRHEDKAAWGPWCYLRNALPVMADLTGYQTRLEHDGGELNLSLWNVMVANGKFAAGGLQVAPRARMDDGLLDVVLVEDGTPLDLATISAEFFLGDYLEDDRVTFLRTRKLRVEANPELRFLADGETLTGQPFEFEAVPDALEVVIP
ncbi:diacylglycerol/lipid kinase family protein [Posidoniimonas polymericola]|nr:diacylglycerol kinase family protein [Posidoniimonas polymericola]